MNKHILLELKKYQHERIGKSPFQTHNDFSNWADSVSPLLSFNTELHDKFNKRRLSADATNKMSPEDYQGNVDACIGIANQAIQLLEHGPHKTKDSTVQNNPELSNIYDIFFHSGYKVKLALFFLALSCFLTGVSLGQSALYAKHIAPYIDLLNKKAAEEKVTIVPENITEQTNMKHASSDIN